MEIIMKIKKTRSNRIMHQTSVMTIIAVIAIMIAGCASNPAPMEQLAVSKAAVTNAARNGGNEYAPIELKSATEKMDAAERAMDEEDYALAKQLAEEAQVDAKLAETKTDLAKVQKSVDEAQESNRVLLEEIKRTTQ
jgi:hypothetical protein